MARREKGPMASKNLYYTIERAARKYDLETGIMNAIRNNANEYRDFIKECYKLRKIVELKLAHESFIEIAGLWTSVSSLFDKTGSTNDIKYIYQASEVLKDLSMREKKTMELLATL